jgi:hypothetical protein
MSVSVVLGEVEAAGVALRLDGERIRMWFPEPHQRERLAKQVAFLRAHRDEVTEFLLARGRVSGLRSPYFWGADRDGKPRDFYGWRANVALDAICEIPAPEGLIVWLGEHSPFLYRRLTRDLPNRISRAWDTQIPYEAFDALCFELVDTYRRAVELYRG